jgi:hypothetical protein
MAAIAARNLLIGLLLFLGIGALGGGGVLIISPSGSMIGMPLSLLAHSPFPSFLIPGIILFLVLGIKPCYLAWVLVYRPENKIAQYFNVFKDMYWGWSYCIYIAFALIIWIQVETIYIGATSWLQTFYLLLSIPIIIVTLLPQMRAMYRL